MACLDGGLVGWWLGWLGTCLTPSYFRGGTDGDKNPIRRWGGGGGRGAGGGGELKLTLHCHYLDDACIKMGTDESHFNVSFIVRGKVTRYVHKPQPLKRKESRSGYQGEAHCNDILPVRNEFR